MPKLRKIPTQDRPREKLSKKGPESLSNLELMAALLGTGTEGRDVLEMASDVLKVMESDPKGWSSERLRSVRGMGQAKTGQILAGLELAKRLLVQGDHKVETSRDVVALVGELRDKKQEHFMTVTLDGANRLIQKRVVFIGTLNESLAHPREIFSDAILDRAASVIFVHNHPSGSVEPSPEDVALTRRLVDAGGLLGIPVLDHVIIAKNRHFSFQENGLLPK